MIRQLVVALMATLLPFTSNVVTGAHRGQQYCFVCELGQRPAVLVFAHRLDSPTRHLMRGLSSLQTKYRDSTLFCWMVYLVAPGTRSVTAAETQAETWVATDNALSTVVVSVLDDLRGPPGYEVDAACATTVLLVKGRQVLATRVYPPSRWNPGAAAALEKDIPRLLKL